MLRRSGWVGGGLSVLHQCLPASAVCTLLSLSRTGRYEWHFRQWVGVGMRGLAFFFLSFLLSFFLSFFDFHWSNSPYRLGIILTGCRGRLQFKLLKGEELWKGVAWIIGKEKAIPPYCIGELKSISMLLQLKWTNLVFIVDYKIILIVWQCFTSSKEAKAA